ncbi:MAG: hypothetical protein RR420_01510 [Anaerovoracaceae bacterium]
MKILASNLSYETNPTGYTIKLNGTPWVVQDGFIPFPGATNAEAAQNHINHILEQQRLAEEHAAREAEKAKKETQNEAAIMELTTIIAGMQTPAPKA